jgi:hypothetical protein
MMVSAGWRFFLVIALISVVAGHSHGARGHHHDHGEVIVPPWPQKPFGKLVTRPLAAGPGSDPACLSESLSLCTRTGRW